jgi:hypothetical protein
LISTEALRCAMWVLYHLTWRFPRQQMVTALRDMWGPRQSWPHFPNRRNPVHNCGEMRGTLCLLKPVSPICSLMLTKGRALSPPVSVGVDCVGCADTKHCVGMFPIARVDKGHGIHRTDLHFPHAHLSCLLFLAVKRSATSSQPPSTTT